MQGALFAIALTIGGFFYLRVARRSYVLTTAELRHAYGLDAARDPSTRRAAAWRAFWWCVPASAWHWRERAWRRQREALRDHADDPATFRNDRGEAV